MFHVVLHRPEIPPNTGNIIRLCANTGAFLHLIHPLGFSMDDTKLRRAGLDYREYAEVRQHSSFEAYLSHAQPARLFALSGSGRDRYADCRFEQGDAFLFGSESAGLDRRLLTHPSVGQVLRIPMLADRRSLNLANSVAIVLFEAWRQTEYRGAI